MALIDSQFVTRIIRHPEEDWLSTGVTSSMLGLDVRPVYLFIHREATAAGGVVPTMETVKQFFPAFRSKRAPEPILFYARQIMDRYAERQLKEATAQLTETLSTEKPDLARAGDIITETSQVLSSLAPGKIVNSTYGRDPKERLNALKEAATGRAADFSLGHSVLDEDLIGAEKGDFYLIAGTPAAGKTWLLLKTLYTLWFKEHLNVLLFSFELNRKLITRRLDSIVAGVRYNLFRRGLLTPDEMRHFQKQLLRLKQVPSFFEILTTEQCDPMAKTSPARLDYVYGKILQLKPDIVGIDGFYLMHGIGDSDWTRMAYLTRGFHGITQATGVNGWATTQLTKTSDDKNPKLRDLSFSWTFAQDTDGAFLLSRPEGSFPIMNIGKFREAEDTLKYALKFNPGAEIEVERMAPVVENPLMD